MSIAGSTLSCTGTISTEGHMTVGIDFSCGGFVESDTEFRVGSNKVVGARGAAIADADGTLADLTTKFNTLLSRDRTHGLIAT